MKVPITITIEEELKTELAEEAKRENRSLSNMVEFILNGYFERNDHYLPGEV